MNNKGDLGIQTLAAGFVLIIIGTFFYNAVYPILNALWIGAGGGLFAEGTYARLLVDLIPLIPVVGLIYLWARN